MPTSHLRLLSALLLLTVLPAVALDHTQPPEVLEKGEGEYPQTMAAFNVYGIAIGVVIINVTVDKTGRPANPQVLECSHADFEAAGIDWALRYRFRPAVKNGEAVEAPFQMRLTFSIGPRTPDAFFEHGTPPFQLPPHTPKDGQPEFQYDVAPLLILHSKAVYPRELLAKNVAGWADVTFIIDPEGRPCRIESQQASRPEFAAATKAMVAIWRFTPAKLRGGNTWTVVRYRQKFDRDSRESPDNPAALRLVKALKSAPDAIIANTDLLDETPQPLYRAAIALPFDRAKKILPASAVVEFILDRDGRVQLPRVVEASNEDFGWAAATAVQRWKYTVPKQKGLPVDVVLRVPFELAAPAPDPAPR